MDDQSRIDKLINMFKPAQQAQMADPANLGTGLPPGNKLTAIPNSVSVSGLSGGPITFVGNPVGSGTFTTGYANAKPTDFRWRMVMGLESGTGKYVTKAYYHDFRGTSKSAFLAEYPDRHFEAIFIIDAEI